MRIHFVCTGNVYRSRLAEAYCASVCDAAIQVESSGIAAGMNEDIPDLTLRGGNISQVFAYFVCGAKMAKDNLSAGTRERCSGFHGSGTP